MEKSIKTFKERTVQKKPERGCDFVTKGAPLRWATHQELEAWINGRGLVSPRTRDILEEPITEEEDND